LLGNPGTLRRAGIFLALGIAAAQTVAGKPDAHEIGTVQVSRDVAQFQL